MNPKHFALKSELPSFNKVVTDWQE